VLRKGQYFCSIHVIPTFYYQFNLWFTSHVIHYFYLFPYFKDRLLCYVCRNHFPHSWLITGCATRVTRRVSRVEQELLTLPEHRSSPPTMQNILPDKTKFDNIYRQNLVNKQSKEWTFNRYLIINLKETIDNYLEIVFQSEYLQLTLKTIHLLN
jgi:hypothetical protein